MDNISVQSLFKLDEERFTAYHNVLKHLVPKPLITNKKISSLTDLTFGEVVTIRMNLQTPSFESITEIFKTVFDIEFDELIKLNAVEFYHALNWMKEEIHDISQREVKQLTSKPDNKLKEAGIEELSMFGELNTLIAIGEKFGKAPQEVENWSYNLVFSLMLHQKKSSEINKRYQELLTPKKP